MSNGGQSVDIKSGPFGLKLEGRDSILILLFIAILAIGAMNYYLHKERQTENAQMVCAIKLALFMQSQPKGTGVDWERLPVDVYGCVPKFLYLKENR